MKKYILPIAVLAASTYFTGCKPHNEGHELITTVRLTCTPTSGSDVKILEFKDIDGDGAGAPVIKVDTLNASTTYNVSTQFLNESTTPVEDVTKEIVKEGTDHQVFYQVSPAGTSTVAYQSGANDNNGKPIGHKAILTTGTASVGNLEVTLKHRPNKNAAGVSSGDITNAGGGTDAYVNLPLIIK